MGERFKFVFQEGFPPEDNYRVYCVCLDGLNTANGGVINS